MTILLLLIFFNFIFTFLGIQINILLLNELLKFVNLLTVHVNTHLVGSCDQIWMNLHLIFYFFVILQVLFFLVRNLVFYIIFNIVFLITVLNSSSS